MPEAEFRASMLRLREDARIRIGVLTQLIESIDALDSLKLMGRPEEPPSAEPARPPRPQPPAPQKTKAAGRRARVVIDDALMARATAILKSSGGTIRPGVLYHRLNLRAEDGRDLQTSMITKNLITVSGKTNQRRMTLTTN